jgi:hypothetical protein
MDGTMSRERQLAGVDEIETRFALRDQRLNDAPGILGSLVRGVVQLVLGQRRQHFLEGGNSFLRHCR